MRIRPPDDRQRLEAPIDASEFTAEVASAVRSRYSAGQLVPETVPRELRAPLAHDACTVQG